MAPALVASSEAGAEVPSLLLPAHHPSLARARGQGCPGKGRSVHVGARESHLPDSGPARLRCHKQCWAQNRGLKRLPCDWASVSPSVMRGQVRHLGAPCLALPIPAAEGPGTAAVPCPILGTFCRMMGPWGF